MFIEPITSIIFSRKSGSGSFFWSASTITKTGCKIIIVDTHFLWKKKVYFMFIFHGWKRWNVVLICTLNKSAKYSSILQWYIHFTSQFSLLIIWNFLIYSSINLKWYGSQCTACYTLHQHYFIDRPNIFVSFLLASY